jgi:hypothetical protein
MLEPHRVAAFTTNHIIRLGFRKIADELFNFLTSYIHPRTFGIKEPERNHIKMMRLPKPVCYS